jgi:hypothetical protein
MINDQTKNKTRNFTNCNWIIFALRGEFVERIGKESYFNYIKTLSKQRRMFFGRFCNVSFGYSEKKAKSIEFWEVNLEVYM